MPQKSTYTPVVVIITALSVEYMAVRSYLTALTEVAHPEGTVYEYGTFSRGLSSWKVALVEIGSGGLTSAAETERALAYFKPDVALFVGIAGGLQGVNIGDVVAASKICGYEFTTSSANFVPAPDIDTSTYRMLQRARAEARKTDWLQSLELSPTVTPPRSHVAPIAAGEKVIASRYEDISRFLTVQYSNALAVELEGHGFLKATYATHHVEALIVRGISGILDNPASMSIHKYQELAAKHASAFAFEVIAKTSLGEVHMTDDLRQEEKKFGSTYKNTFHGPVNNIVQGDHISITLHNSRPK